ncbi:EAL domain-containing protein [Luteimonas dalianensis]|uniref:EAL domain-containing response regulator n=1 Tax=Luteimonas dalianensis TaxID=1148196 RepID=UPI003BF09229
MAKNQDNALRLMVVDDSMEDAEAIVSTLRNAGIAVRPLRPATSEELAGMLAGQGIDMVLAAVDATGIALEDVSQQLLASGKDVPLLAVTGSIDSETFKFAHGHGVRRIVLRDNSQLLLGAVRDERNDLDARRALRRLEVRIRETERRCDALIDSSRDPIAYIHEGMHIRANGAYLEMFGYDSFDDVEGISLLDMVASQHVEEFKDLLKRMAKGEPPPARHELEARDIEGNGFPASMEFTHAQYEGEPCLQVIFRREETDPELARQVEELRQRDQVTGLLNRPTFLRRLEDAVSNAADAGGRHGLLMIEPDNYQNLLQEIGLDAADDLAQAAAELLLACVGEGAVTARYSEHRLAVLVPDADYGVTTELAKQLLAAFSGNMFHVGRHSVVITVSIGGVQIGEKIASVSQVLAKADEGVHTAAGVGGNRHEIFDPGAVDRAEEEHVQAWVARLRDALDNNGFVLHYQPVISLHGDSGAVYESLLRLDDGKGELVKPLEFLQIAEEQGLLWEIDHHVVGRAIARIGERMKADKPTTLLVKISQASLHDDSLVRYIGEQLAQHGVPGEYLVLQLPEAKVFTHLKAVRDFAEAIGKYDCRLALSQFGVGLDSFQLLSHLQPHLLKLDRSFSEELAQNADNQQRVNEIATKAREMGIRTVVEHIQDAASMSILFGAGVDYAQGNFLAGTGPEMTYDFD